MKIPNFRKNILVDFLVTLIQILFINQVFFIGFKLEYFYFIIIFAVMILLVFLSSEIFINKRIFGFFIVAFFSVFLNEIPIFFRPYQRLFGFFLLLLLTSDLLNSRQLFNFRVLLFDRINRTLVFLVNLSFIGFLLNATFVYGRGGVSGFFNHSMVLGPIASLSLLYSLFKFYSELGFSRYYYASSIVSSFTLCLAAGSRAALVAGVFSFLIFYFLKNGRNTSRLLKTVSIIILALIVTFPLWRKFTERIGEKMEYSQEQGDLFVTRTALIQMRINEFIKSPIIGVGFSSVDIKISDRFDKETGIVEPGSSWLALLSMTGIIGFILMNNYLIRKLLRYFNSNISCLRSSYLTGVFIFFIIHLFFEGYLLAAGSGLGFYFWLFVGVEDQMKDADLLTFKVLLN